jgi:hypothetical protein
VSDLPSKRTQRQRGKRHPLLYHQRLSEQYFWPAVLIVAISGGLLVWNPGKLEPYRLVLSVSLACCGMVLVLTLLFRLRAYAVCTAHGLQLQLPFYRLEIPYRDIKDVRPTELFRLFPPREQGWAQRRFLMGILGATVLVIALDELPARTAWLRLWMSKYMLCPDHAGLVIAVRDWIGFRTELDEFRARQRHPRP